MIFLGRILLLGALSISTACGVKGMPLPPVPATPQASEPVPLENTDTASPTEAKKKNSR